MPSAIVLIWSQVTEPTFVLLGIPEPFCSFAASLREMATGGCFTTKSKDLSEYTVMTTGRTFPACACVAALNFLQKSMMFSPLEPRAGPTGGAGFAAPALIWSLMNPVTSFAIENYSFVT